MKIYNKYIALLALSLGFLSCETESPYPPITDDAPEVALNINGLDLSNYVSVGASFTAGFTDGGLFIAGQQNSFPNILASKFAMATGDATFNQPLMADNNGGFAIGNTVIQGPRFVFDPSTGRPAQLTVTPTTNPLVSVYDSQNTFNNYGVPGAKSFHFVAPNYGNASGLFANPRTANPYFVRMASSPSTSVMADVAAKQPTFFTLSEIGGNDVLGYALSGGDGSSPITPTPLFEQAFDGIVASFGGAKGVVGNIPYITSLAHFTTVPHNPLDPTENAQLAGQIPLLNTVYGAINQVYAGAGEPERSIVFATDQANPVVIYDEDATDLTRAIAVTLGNSPTFVPFVQSLGLPAQAAPLVAQLLGRQYGKARSATSNDLLVLPSSSVIGTVNTAHAGNLINLSGGLLPASLAGQFSAEGVTLPLGDKWVLTPQEQAAIKTATDAYNNKIKAVVDANANLVLADLNSILQQASTSGIVFDGYTMNTSLVMGGLISLDGVHLTARGYALMANEVLKAMDAGFGTNFQEATNGLAKADDYTTNYPPVIP